MFVGSSTEGLPFANAVRAAMEADAEITVWNEDFFGLGQTFIEALVTQLPRFDFALLVLTPDDLVVSRDVESLGPRDNVLFELGLFMGRLGRSRTFVLHQAHADLKLPSDLAGLVTATYAWPRSDNNHRAAVGAASASIRRAILDLGVVETKTAGALVHLRSRQDAQDKELTDQQRQIRSLHFVLQGIVTRYELDKLLGLLGDDAFMCYYSDDLYAELKRLRAIGLILHHEGTGLTDIRSRYKDRNEQFDLKRYFQITREGREYVTLRSEMSTQESSGRE